MIINCCCNLAQHRLGAADHYEHIWVNLTVSKFQTWDKNSVINLNITGGNLPLIKMSIFFSGHFTNKTLLWPKIIKKIINHIMEFLLKFTFCSKFVEFSFLINLCDFYQKSTRWISNFKYFSETILFFFAQPTHSSAIGW